MIVETRYRDVPWDSILDCVTDSSMCIGPDGWDQRYRGRPIAIITPAIPRPSIARCSTGPFFRIVRDKNGSGFVCPHMAEIGD